MSINTAFVLPGGGSLGAVQVGMLQALTEENILPELVIGSSAGAINAAYFSTGPSSDTVERLAQIWGSLRTSEIFSISALGSFQTLFGMRSYLCDSDNLEKLLRDNFTINRIEESSVPLRIAVTDVLNGEYLHLSKGELVSAVLASSAIPAVFAPVQIDDRYLIDGSVADHVPAGPAIEEFKAERVIVLPAGFTCARSRPPASAIDMALHSMNILLGRQLQTMMQIYSKRAEIFIIPPLCPVKTKMHDFSKAGSLINDAYHSTQQWLKNGGLDKKSEINRRRCNHDGVPYELLPHSH